MGISSDSRCPSDAATAKISRLNRIAGQVRDVALMIEDDRYCMDILHQIQAIKSALAKVETQVLKDHAACCIAEAIASGDEAEQRQKFSELIDLLERTRK
ncbi:MAG: metal-sensitive transcriptional regulator [Proteobacteria bacterium]|nr:metal-sensitive transcriptional regulator [Pseudomonadota bacterium]MDA0913916.1 metal-sensitive transcriptional regulator [Pseudomonadota bacterium]MDA1033638.1 metal-sensitive transcriptional regulator [Pseudomonadota bacterium]